MIKKNNEKQREGLRPVIETSEVKLAFQVRVAMYEEGFVV